MPRLYRPYIPLEVRCRVALRQLGDMFADELIKETQNTADPTVAPSCRAGFGKLLPGLLTRLATLLGCEVKDLRLDHDPPLAARPRFRRGLGKTYYAPAANDPEHLRYRPHGPQFEGSHLIKTNVRGDHGQFPDRVLIKRERKRKAKKPKRKSRLRSANRWPPRGSQKIQNRSKR